MNISYESLSVCHAEGLEKIWADENVIRYTNIKFPCSHDEIIKRIKKFSVHEVFAIMLDEEIIGVVGCPYEDYDKKIFGLFYMLKKSVWNNGIAGQSVEWILAYMKKQYTKATIYADVVDCNTASEKILVKNGFKLISTDKNAFLRDEESYDIKSYKLEL